MHHAANDKPVYQPQQKYRRNQTILFIGEAPHGARRILSGYVHVYALTRGGDRRTVSILGPGDVFPAEWIADFAAVSLFYYAALTECELIEKVDASTSQLAPQLAASYLHAAALQQNRAIDTIRSTLYYLAMRFGRRRSGGWRSIPLRLTHQDIAILTGHTRETVTVNVRLLVEQGFLRRQASFYYDAKVTPGSIMDLQM